MQGASHEIAVSVRRTACDAPLGVEDVAAEEDVCKVLSAENKLVGWSSCGFFLEARTKNALPCPEAILGEAVLEICFEAEANCDGVFKGVRESAPACERMHEGVFTT